MLSWVQKLPLKNKYRSLNLPLALAILLFGCSAQSESNIQEKYYRVTTNKPLEEVLDDAAFAITERNFRIIEQLHIGEGIRKRGYPHFPDYEVILYCNLTLAREMLILAPALINECPYRVTFRQQSGQIVIAAPLLPKSSNQALTKQVQALNTMTREIVDYAADDWLD